jgi:hypothetical protein
METLLPVLINDVERVLLLKKSTGFFLVSSVVVVSLVVIVPLESLTSFK